VAVHAVRLLRGALPRPGTGQGHSHPGRVVPRRHPHVRRRSEPVRQRLPPDAAGSDLPLWCSLAVYGLDVAASLATQTAGLIKAAPQLELIREPDLDVVLFRRLGNKPQDYDPWAKRLHPATTMELVREVLARTK
jgi:hypothetical protein